MAEAYHTQRSRTIPDAALSAAHRHRLEVESGIAPEIIGGRGYRSVTRAEVPDDFASYQRRGGLLIPLYSPDGTTTAPQLRPDKPRRDKRGKPIKYETPTGGRLIADVHPRMLGAVQDGDGTLWITEGTKKADALASRGRAALALIGVWTFRKKKSEEMLRCFEHVALRGRRVFIVYDSDVMTKMEVAMALERLVGDLERRGARPMVIYLPGGPNGEKVGVDDWLAAGGTVAQLGEMARPFDPTTLARYRLERNPQLREMFVELGAAWRAAPWRGRGGHTRREIMRALIEDAARRGEVVQRGVLIPTAQRPLAERVGTRQATVSGHLKALEEEGWLERDTSEERPPDAGGFHVLRVPDPAWPHPYHYGETGGREETQHTQRKTGICREYYPGDTGGATALGPSVSDEAAAEIRRLRWSYVAREYDPGERAYVHNYIRRLDKIAGRVLEALLELEGSAEAHALAEAVSERRPSRLLRDERRLRVRPAKALHDRTVVDYELAGRVGPVVRLQDAGIVSVRGTHVSITEDWREKLGLARELGGEYEAEEDARKRHRANREAYRNRHTHKADHAPTQEEMDSDPRREDRDKRQTVDVLKGQGMRHDFAMRAVYGADGFTDELESSEATDEWGELLRDLLGAGATPQEALEHLERMREDRSA